MLNINRKLSKKGFSLIELMVAVVILAIAILGIFLAFSNAWMGMANARDRTVATNYAREAMEDVKNMDFELVTPGNLGTAESVGTKFTRVIIVNTENENLKKIDTTVSWTNRQEQYVSVKTSMYINRTLFNPGEAAKLVLYADPYYTVLPTAGTATIIAVIKDINGNTKIDWTGGNIRFSIKTGSSFGSLPAGAYVPGVEPDKGRADTIFTGSAEGDVVIEASVDLPNGGGTISDTITIRVTLDVVRIKLSAVPDKIKADGTNISTVTAALVNSGDETVEGALNKITFVIDILGEGSFVDSGGTPLGFTTVIRDPELGIAKIYVKSTNNIPGVATVTASSDGLLSGTVNINITGFATSIYVSVVPDLIYIGDTDGARVTLETQDVNGNPVKYTGSIDLSITGGTGIFGNNSPYFADVSSVETTFSSTSVGTITITASGGGLTGNAIIEVREALIADTITITAVPKNILAGGLGVSVITATIKQGSTVISSYKNPITFEIVLDTSTSKSAKFSDNTTYIYLIGADYGNDGVAVVNLKPSDDVGICTINVSTVNSLGILINKTVKVGSYSSEHHIRLSAFPSKMLVNGGTCTVTAEVVDEAGIIVTSYNKDITFTILVGWPKIAKFIIAGTSSLTKTLIGGVTTVNLISQKVADTVTLKASSFTDMTNITGYLNIPVVAALTDLELALEPHIFYDVNQDQVSFDIYVQGADLFLEGMQISWSPNDSETLNTIYIGGNEVYSNVAGVVSGTNVDTVDTLPTGIYKIILYFNDLADMSGKTFNIIFNKNSGNYPVEFIVP